MFTVCMLVFLTLYLSLVFKICPELVFVNLFRSAGIDSQPGGTDSLADRLEGEYFENQQISTKFCTTLFLTGLKVVFLKRFFVICY
jgi:hypothetical protein